MEVTDLWSGIEGSRLKGVLPNRCDPRFFPKLKVNRRHDSPQRMITAHALLQVNRVTEQFPLALLFSHHGKSALPNRGDFGYYYF